MIEGWVDAGNVNGTRATTRAPPAPLCATSSNVLSRLTAYSRSDIEHESTPLVAVRMICNYLARRQFIRPKSLSLVPNLLRPPLFRRGCSEALSNEEIRKLLAKPTWSVNSLQEDSGTPETATSITQKQLHHLLRLSALPMPRTPEAETEMIETLQAQLRFVQAVQSVDTDGVPPLAAIRDETQAAIQENTVSLETLKDELDKEEQRGFMRRIVRKDAATRPKAVSEDGWDPLEAAPTTRGRFISIPKTASDSG